MLHYYENGKQRLIGYTYNINNLLAISSCGRPNWPLHRGIRYVQAHFAHCIQFAKTTHPNSTSSLMVHHTEDPLFKGRNPTNHSPTNQTLTNPNPNPNPKLQNSARL